MVLHLIKHLQTANIVFIIELAERYTANLRLDGFRTRVYLESFVSSSILFLAFFIFFRFFIFFWFCPKEDDVFVAVLRRCFVMIHKFYTRALPLVVVAVADPVIVVTHAVTLYS